MKFLTYVARRKDTGMIHIENCLLEDIERYQITWLVQMSAAQTEQSKECGCAVLVEQANHQVMTMTTNVTRSSYSEDSTLYNFL